MGQEDELQENEEDEHLSVVVAGKEEMPDEGGLLKTATTMSTWCPAALKIES